MFNQDDIQTAARMYQQGCLPSEILRFLALQHQKASIPDLMQLMRETFSLSYQDVQCMGGWWHDGTGELSDDQLNAFLVKSIEKLISNSI